jgi:glutamyl-Q tRNA(Asp) synthetase
VTHVVRGEDLAEAVHVQRLLQALLGLPTPVYHHHPLIRDAHGRRLAKRAGAPSLESLRQEGLGAGEVRARLGLPPAV